MKNAALILTLLFGASAMGQMTAREYFNELHAAGGLDQMAALYVCFQDDPKAVNFFIFSESKLLRFAMQQDGTFSLKLTKLQQQELNKEYLNLRAYQQGVPSANELYLDKDGDSWVTEKFILPGTKTSSLIRFTLNWQTLRYKWAVEYGQGKEVSSFGRCEHITGYRAKAQ